MATKLAVAPKPDAALRRKLTGAVTLIVAGAALIGGAPELITIAARWGVPCPWVLPVCLDGVGISAAIALHGAPKDKFAWLSLLLASGTSTLVRVASAPDEWVAQVIYAAQGIAGPLAVHQFLRTTEVAIAPVKRTKDPAPAAKPGGALLPPATPAHPAGPVLALDDDDPELEVARTIAAGWPTVGWRTLGPAMAEAGHPVTKRRATELARLVRERAA